MEPEIMFYLLFYLLLEDWENNHRQTALMRRCDVSGLQMRPSKDATPELRCSLCEMYKLLMDNCGSGLHFHWRKKVLSLYGYVTV